MKIIDLTFPIYDGMPVYPGDEGLVVEQASTVQDDEWGMKRLHINLHDGTHLNMPAHTVVEGKTLDDFPVQAFMGPCVLNRLKEGRGSIFTQQLTQELYDEILQLRPLFVGFDHCLEQEELPYERGLCENEIISYERLNNCDQLPDEFMFHGVPLPVREGDGSPVRAYAIVS